MRRLLPVLVLLLAGCGGAEALTTATPLGQGPAPAPVLRIPDPSGVSLLDTETGRVRTRVRGGVRSRDWVFQARLTPTGTSVIAVDGRGRAAWQRDVDGDLAVRIASSDGTRVALLPFDDERVDPYHPAGRLTTALTVLPTDGSQPRTYELDGNFEPEAFSTSGRSLFVVEYLPPEAPDRYRVRMVDLDTGEVGAVYSADGHLQESMRGTARVQAMDAGGTRLYTLYTTDDGSAFVHVLDLDEEWAHCVDLPAPIGWSPEHLLAIAASPEDDRVVVVDAMAGVAELDTETLTVGRSVDLVVDPSQAGRVMAVFGRDGRLFTGVGATLAVLDRDLTYERMWSAPTTILGIHLDPVDDRLWTVGGEAVYALDPRTGDVLQAAALHDDVPPIEVPVPLGPTMQCAC